MKARKETPGSFVVKYRNEQARRLRTQQALGILAFYPESVEATAIVREAHKARAEAGMGLPTRAELGMSAEVIAEDQKA